jgi:putative SOS response-associated peptidase YedK
VTRWGLSLSNPRAKGFNARGEHLGRLYGHTARALVVVSGFYEWRTLGPKRKQPFLVERADGAPLILAGIRDAEGCAIVTTKATGLVATLHDRMPVVLERADLRRWLLPDTRPQSLVAAASADALRMHPVANDVGDVRNNHPGLAACVEEAPADPPPKKQLDLF